MVPTLYALQLNWRLIAISAFKRIAMIRSLPLAVLTLARGTDTDYLNTGYRLAQRSKKTIKEKEHLNYFAVIFPLTERNKATIRGRVAQSKQGRIARRTL